MQRLTGGNGAPADREGKEGRREEEQRGVGEAACRGKVSPVNEYLKSRNGDAKRLEVFNGYVKKGHLVDWFGGSRVSNARHLRKIYKDPRKGLLKTNGGINSEEPRAPPHLDARDAAGDSICCGLTWGCYEEKDTKRSRIYH